MYTTNKNNNADKASHILYVQSEENKNLKKCFFSFMFLFIRSQITTVWSSPTFIVSGGENACAFLIWTIMTVHSSQMILMKCTRMCDYLYKSRYFGSGSTCLELSGVCLHHAKKIIRHDLREVIVGYKAISKQ